jgi:hypothetical protein
MSCVDVPYKINLAAYVHWSDSGQVCIKWPSFAQHCDTETQGLNKRRVQRGDLTLRDRGLGNGARHGCLKQFEKTLALNCVILVISTTGILSRVASLRARAMAEGSPAEIIEGWWCLCSILENHTFYSERWKITSRHGQLWAAAWRCSVPHKDKELGFQEWVHCWYSPGCLLSKSWGALFSIPLSSSACALEGTWTWSAKVCTELSLWAGAPYLIASSLNCFTCKVGVVIPEL